MIQTKRFHLWFFLLSIVTIIALPFSVYAQSDVAKGKAAKITGFKVGGFHLHPAFSLQNMFDTNVTNTSDRYNESFYKTRYPDRPVSKTYDDLLYIIGAFKANYPGTKFAFTFDSQVSYIRYFGIEDESTVDMSGLTAKARASISAFQESIVGFTLNESFTRSISASQVGLALTNKRIHNTAKFRLQILPGGGQLHLYLGYRNDLELYDSSSKKNQNWLAHKVFFDWDLTFLPKTAVFMNANFTVHDYFEFDATNDNASTNTKSPNAMPLKVSVGIFGKITPKFHLNISAGYGNSFSENYASFNNAIAKVEFSTQFVQRSMMKIGAERDFAPVTTFSYRTDHKFYLEYKHRFLNERLQLYLKLQANWVWYGPEDRSINLNYDATGDPKRLPSGERKDWKIETTPTIRYNILSWFAIEAGYTLATNITDYYIERIDAAAGETPQNTTDEYWAGRTYYDYLTHQVFLKLTLSY